MSKVEVANLSTLADRQPAYAMVSDIDLVIVKYDNNVSVFYGRCAHRGVLMSDGYVDGDNLVCGIHYWDYRLETGVSEYNNEESLHKFNSWIEEGAACIDEDEVSAWAKEHPQKFNRDGYLGQYADTDPIETEDKVSEIQNLAKYGLSKWGHHGASGAMGVPRTNLPKWDNIQILTGQLHKLTGISWAGIS